MKFNIFELKYDNFGIKKLLFEIFNKYCFQKDPNDCYLQPYKKQDEEFYFNIFFHQSLPPIYYETRSTVLRHLTDIKRILNDPSLYKKHTIWTKYKNNFKSSIINDSVLERIKKGELEVPNYIEIEEEKTKWQSKPTYNKELGFSNALKEEYIQIKIHK